MKRTATILIFISLPFLVSAHSPCARGESGDAPKGTRTFISAGSGHKETVMNETWWTAEEQGQQELIPALLTERRGYPDLAVTKVALDFKSNEIIAQVANIGDCATKDRAFVTFYYYYSRKGKICRKKIHREEIGALACGPKNAFTVSARTSDTNMYRQIEVLVDSDSSIDEITEENNSFKVKTDKDPPPGFYTSSSAGL